MFGGSGLDVRVSGWPSVMGGRRGSCVGGGFEVASKVLKGE